MDLHVKGLGYGLQGFGLSVWAWIRVYGSGLFGGNPLNPQTLNLGPKTSNPKP